MFISCLIFNHVCFNHYEAYYISATSIIPPGWTDIRIHYESLVHQFSISPITTYYHLYLRVTFKLLWILLILYTLSNIYKTIIRSSKALFFDLFDIQYKWLMKFYLYIYRQFYPESYFKPSYPITILNFIRT